MRPRTSPDEFPPHLAEMLALLPEESRLPCALAFGAAHTRAASLHAEMHREMADVFDMDAAASRGAEHFKAVLAREEITDEARVETLCCWFSRGFRYAFETRPGR